MAIFNSFLYVYQRVNLYFYKLNLPLQLLVPTNWWPPSPVGTCGEVSFPFLGATGTENGLMKAIGEWWFFTNIAMENGP